MAGIPQNMTSKLSFIKIFGIFTLTAAGAIALGASVAMNYSDKEAQATDVVHVGETQQQNTAVTESFAKSLEQLQSSALALRDNPASIPNGSVLHFADLEVRGGLILAVKRQVANPTWKQPTTVTGLQAVAFESSYLKEAVQSLSLKNIRENGVGMIEVSEEHERSPKFLAFAFYTQAVPGSLALVLVDPMQAFGVFKTMSGSGSFYRSYLLGLSGSVLAHSQSAYVSAHFGELPIYEKSNESSHGVVHAQAIDHLPTIAAWSKLENLPLTVVVERVELVPDLGWLGKLKQVAMTALIGLTALVVLLVTAAKVIVRSTTSRKNYVIPQVSMETSAGIEVKAVPLGHDIDKMVQQAQVLRELSASERIHKKNLEEKLLLEKFESEAAKSRDLKAFAERLASTTSRFCKSPTLYFSHQESTRLGILVSDSGFENGDAPAAMTFPISSEVNTRLQQADAREEMLSLTEYPPLARAIMNRTGVAHFEAWPVCSRRSGKVCLLGVLVILQPGVDSDLHRDSIARMMRATGLTYENAFVSR